MDYVGELFRKNNLSLSLLLSSSLSSSSLSSSIHALVSLSSKIMLLKANTLRTENNSF